MLYPEIEETRSAAEIMAGYAAARARLQAGRVVKEVQRPAPKPEEPRPPARRVPPLALLLALANPATPARNLRITSEQIKRAVASAYGVSVTDIDAERRHKAIVRPRHVAIYLATKLTTASLPEVGHRFGGRDHTTVINAVRRVEALLQTDEGVRAQVEALTASLEAGVPS